MTYASKGEKIFGCPLKPACTPPIPKRSDGRLKRYSSIWNDTIWSLEEEKRYRYLYNMMGGSQTCITSSSCFKFIPLEEIINLLLADKDAYINCLEKRLNELDKTKDEISINELFKACQFEDEEQDVLNTRNKVSGPNVEEYKNTRDNLRQAMHKLENIDEIINENKCLKDKLRCSEEMIRYLEEKKSKLEKELENLRTKSQIQMDLQDAQETLNQTIKRQRQAEGEELNCLARERDLLQQRVCELQNELRQAKSKQSQLELLKKQSETTSIGVEEIIKENECYRKKLASMKCLEKQILELKKQANILAEKYKRDASKASDQDKKLKCISKELQCLREERDKLKNRVNELACYETQYNSFQTKLEQIDCILAENEILNNKLADLDKLEMENELLRCKLEKCQASELEAAESKKKIIELQNAVADQEEGMKDLLCQIERLTRAYTDSDGLDRLKEELCEKDCKLKLCEEQLAEIPLLEAEIDDLRSRLENCYNNIKLTMQKPPKPEEVTTIGARYEDNVEFENHMVVFEEAAPEETAVMEKRDGEKGSMTCEEVQNLLQSSECVLEDKIEHQKEMDDLEKCKEEIKTKICFLKERMGETKMDNCFEQVAELKRIIEEKEIKICCLEKQLARTGDLEKVNEHIRDLECEIECLKNLNKKMRADLEEACCEVQRCAEIECMLEEERRARADLAKQLDFRRSKSRKEEFNLEAKESSNPSLNELEDLKNNVEVMNKLVEELRKENALLKEMKVECPDYLNEIDEKRALEKLLCQLQSELDTCREEKLSDNCEDLKLEVKHLQEQNCQLKSLVSCYKERLDLETCSKQNETSENSCSENLQDTNNKLRSELTRLRCESIELCKRIQKYERQICDYESELAEAKACCQGLVRKNDDLEKEVDEKVNESHSLKGEVSRLLDERYKLASENDVLKNRLEEAESVSPEVQKKDYKKDLTEKHALESTMRNFEGEVDGLKAKLEECNKAEQERGNLLKKQEDLEAEIQNLRKQLAGAKDVAETAKKAEASPASEDKKSFTSQEAKAKEEKLLEEMVGMREQTVKIQAEANEAKAENKKLKDRLDELQKQLDQCNKDKANEEAQASLMSAKYQAMMSTLPPQPQGVPQTAIPIKEEQRVSVYERTTPGEVKQTTPGAKVAFIENQAQPELVKVVAEAKDFKKEKQETSNKERENSKPALTPSKTAQVSSPKVVGFQSKKETDMASAKNMARTPSKATVSSSSKGTKLTPSKAAMLTPSQIGMLTPSKAAMLTPSKAAIWSSSKGGKLTPSKAAMLTPSKAAMLTPSKAAMLTPSKAAILTPSKAAMLTPSKAAVLTPSFTALAGKKRSPDDEETSSAKKPASAPDTFRSSDSDESILDITEADSDFTNFLCKLNPADYKQNLCEIEKRYKQKLCEIQCKNEEKVKRLIQQHEKEERVREKLYNDNVSSMRTGYNTDIHKLVEKHKASILRLQSLHEEEVQELNTNYETQLEAMQTQNENVVNDLTMGAAAKFKLLADQHNKDMKELERKYQELLEKKEKEHVTDLTNINSESFRTGDGKNRTGNEGDIDIRGGEGNVTDLKTKHDRELKNLKRSNLKRIDMIRHKYEDLLTCERKKYEKQLEDMVERLRKGKGVAHGLCQCRMPGPCAPKDPDAPLELNDVLQKILTEGLENLTFNEIALIHRKTCAATEELVLNPEARPELEPSMGEEIYCGNELRAEKKDLLNRILLMENDIAAKQRENHDAIINMEMAVKAERERLQELKNAFRSERERNPLSNISKEHITGRDVKSGIDFRYTPTPEQDIILKLDELQKAKCQPMVPERDIKILHRRESVLECGKRISPKDDYCSKRKRITKKMPRK